MDREVIKSSNIRSAGYDKESQTLEVEFASGAVYRYKNVPQQIYNEFNTASSKGKYFAKNIKHRFKFG